MIISATAKQLVVLRARHRQRDWQKDLALVKDSKLKVQSQIQGDKVRVTGKKRDDLQEAIACLSKAKLEVPLQFNNFRD